MFLIGNANKVTIVIIHRTQNKIKLHIYMHTKITNCCHSIELCSVIIAKAFFMSC